MSDLRGPGGGPRRIDLGLAALCALVPSVAAVDAPGGAELDVVGHLLLVGAGCLLLLHRRWPIPTFLLTVAFHVTYLALGYPEGLDWMAPAVALGSVTWSRGWRWGASLGGALLALAVSSVIILSDANPLDAEVILIVLGLGLAVGVGMWLRTREAYVRAVEDRAAILERTRADEAQRMVDEERLRIAREVHDVVAHAIASINVQAGVGRHVAERDPAAAATALTAIRQASGEALADLRALLGMLRLDDRDDPPERHGLADIETLLSRAREVGIDVEVVEEGSPAALPSPVDMAAYRIVQEAVTNTIRHAGASRLTVHVAHGPDVLELSVRDDGRGHATAVGVQVDRGHGIRGMQERATTLGGALEAGPGPDGFQVVARLPVRRAGVVTS